MGKTGPVGPVFPTPYLSHGERVIWEEGIFRISPVIRRRHAGTAARKGGRGSVRAVISMHTEGPRKGSVERGS